MADIIDDAQAYNEFYQQVALKNQQAKVAPESHPDFDGLHCVDCEEEIPALRLLMSRIRCVGCQEYKEHVEHIQRHNSHQGD